MLMSNPTEPPSLLAAATTQPRPCLCSALRRAARGLTRRYDAHLKPAGLKVTQYSMLANICRNPRVAVSALADLMAMDQTTVTRNLQLLLRKGYVSLEPAAEDQRVRLVDLSDAGRAKLEEALPLWRQAQAEIEQELGGLGADVLFQSLRALAR